jgi:inositol oxygenase
MDTPVSRPRTPDPGHAWEEFIVDQVYPQAGTKAQAEYRNYESPSRESVRRFYEENHRRQTVAFVQGKRAEYLPLARRRMSVFEALDYLNTLVDDSDPDI